MLLQIELFAKFLKTNVAFVILHLEVDLVDMLVAVAKLRESHAAAVGALKGFLLGVGAQMVEELGQVGDECVSAVRRMAFVYEKFITVTVPDLPLIVLFEDVYGEVFAPRNASLEINVLRLEPMTLDYLHLTVGADFMLQP